MSDEDIVTEVLESMAHNAQLYVDGSDRKLLGVAYVFLPASVGTDCLHHGVRFRLVLNPSLIALSNKEWQELVHEAFERAGELLLNAMNCPGEMVVDEELGCRMYVVFRGLSHPQNTVIAELDMTRLRNLLFSAQNAEKMERCRREEDYSRDINWKRVR